ncbi:MAG: NAD-dependent epimerase/dehydratase family protein [Myxococcota bacterium]
MNVLVTGAAGQIGTDLLCALRASGDTVFASDIRLPAPADDRDGSGLAAQWRVLDITDRDQVTATLAEIRPDVVYHLAAVLSARGESDPQLTYRVNQQGTYHLLEACRQAGVGRLILTSTIAVYGSDLPEPTPEDVALHPTTMYGVTKAAGELLGAYYAQRYDLDVRGLRFPGLISASAPGGGTSDYALYMYTEGIRTGTYRAFCRPDTRIPLMYMPDAVRALRELAAAPRAALSRCVYNVTAFSPTAREIAASVMDAVPRVSITFEPDPARQAILDSWPRALDDSRARRDWSWRPDYDLAAMTADLIPTIQADSER